MDGMDGWLSYTAVTPRASLKSDANNLSDPPKRIRWCALCKSMIPGSLLLSLTSASSVLTTSVLPSSVLPNQHWRVRRHHPGHPKAGGEVQSRIPCYVFYIFSIEISWVGQSTKKHSAEKMVDMCVDFLTSINEQPMQWGFSIISILSVWVLHSFPAWRDMTFDESERRRSRQ